MASSCTTRCDFLYTECREYRDIYGYYEICEDVYDCRTDLGNRRYLTADAQNQWDATLIN